MHIAAFLPLAVLPFALATTHNVSVGINKDGAQGLYYYPDDLKPAENDTIVFTFYSDRHSVAQSDFDNPCKYINNGIYAGFPGVNHTFTMTVNTTDPIWLFCSEEGHCQSGQALVLNAPSGKTLSAYKEAAASAESNIGDDNQPAVRGGIVAEAESTPSSTAASSHGTATSTGGSRAATSGAATTGRAATSVGAAGTSGVTAPPAATSTGAADRFTAGAGLGVMGLLGFLVGGMI